LALQKHKFYSYVPYFFHTSSMSLYLSKGIPV
jgi:hypothetical protein